jgi:hypothetical protein
MNGNQRQVSGGRGCLYICGLGLGLGVGAGFIYVMVVNETAFIIFLALGMFILGGVVMGLALLIQNRQWTRAVFGAPAPRPPHISYNNRIYPNPQLSAGYGYSHQPDYEQFQVIEGGQAANALTDDSPMA